MLLKELPDENYLHDLQERGILRASMSFLPGGCYAGAGLFDSPMSYVTSDGPTADTMCPNPMDTVGCLLWETMAAVQKLSHMRPFDYNAFLFVEREPGTADSYTEAVLRASGGEAGEDGLLETDRGLQYVAAAHLVGCGAYNSVVEVLAEDHDRMVEVLHALTDLPYVRQYALGRVRADDTRGFGEVDG